MSDSLEVFKIEEKIKIAYLKHGGNVLEVMQELGLPEEYVRKKIEKLKKKDARDVSSLIANNISSYILMGHESRKIHYLQVLKELETSGKVALSVCCETPVLRDSTAKDMGVQSFTCSLCKNPCEIKIATNADVYRIKKEILNELREEDKLLMDFAEKMGYTNIAPQPKIKVDQNIIVFNREDQKIIDEVKNLPQKDRNKLIDKIDSEIKKNVES